MRWGGGVEGFELPKGVMPPRGSQGFIESFSVVPGKYNVKLSYGHYEMISIFEILTDPRNETHESHFLDQLKSQKLRSSRNVHTKASHYIFLVQQKKIQ